MNDKTKRIHEMENDTQESFYFVLLDEIESFQEDYRNNKCKIKLKPNKDWKDFGINKDNFEFSCQSQNTNAGVLYETQGYILLESTNPNLDILKSGYQYIVIKHTDKDGESTVLGTQQYPLSFTLSTNLATYKLDFKGQQITPPYTYED